MIRVLCWSDATEPKTVYPLGIDGTLAAFLNKEPGIEATSAQIDDLDQGTPEETLSKTDVLIWFGHSRHDAVEDEAVHRIINHVRGRGMGFAALHSSHFAKPFKALMGTTCTWRAYEENAQPAQIRVAKKLHPIALGIDDFKLPQTEYYGEPFDVPMPDEVILSGYYESHDEVSRDAMTWNAGNGRVFYFRPGHETYPIYHHPCVQKVLINAVRWLAQ